MSDLDPRDASSPVASAKPKRRRRDVSPAAVASAAPQAAAPQPRPPDDDTVARNLGAMVNDLMRKLRETEERLKEKDAAISRLQEQTVTMARQINLPAEGGDEGVADDLGSLDLYGRIAPECKDLPPDKVGVREKSEAISLEKLARAASEAKKARVTATANRDRDREPRPRTATATVPTTATQAAEAGRLCPGCGQKLRKAKCESVLSLVCLRCKGVFVDSKVVQHLARSQPWFALLDKYLRGAPAGQKATSGQRPSRGSGLKASAR